MINNIKIYQITIQVLKLLIDKILIFSKIVYKIKLYSDKT